MANDIPGPAVDQHGATTFDPSYNVQQVVEAAVKRQDDLRESESSHIRELMQVRSDHEREMRQAEAERLDAIRAVDVGAVQQAAATQTQQAGVLAATVSASAEALRNQVAAQAITQASALTAALDPIKTDIADLRKTQYEQAGQKAQVIETRSSAEDMAPMFAAIAELTAAQNRNVGAGQQVTESRLNVNMLLAVGGFLFAVLIAVVGFAVNNGGGG